MQITSPPRWFRIVSIAIAVFPVERSPMISSRWPRPSRGLPRGSTTRPSSPSPTGTLITSPVRLTGSPSFTWFHSPKSAVPTLSSSRLKAMPTTPCSSSSRSRATQFSSPWTRAMPSPTCNTVPTSERSVSTSNSWMRSLRIAVISSGLSFTLSPLGAWHPQGAWPPLSSCRCQFVSQALEAAADAAVGAERADLQDDAADQRRVDRARGLNCAARGLLDRLHDRAGVLLGELVRGRELNGEPVLRAIHERLQLGLDLRKLAGAALLRDQAHEVPHELVRSGGDLGEDGRLLRRIDLWVPQESAQLRDLVEGGREGMELLRDPVELPLLLGSLEERPGVHALR